MADKHLSLAPLEGVHINPSKGRNLTSSLHREAILAKSLDGKIASYRDAVNKPGPLWVDFGAGREFDAGCAAASHQSIKGPFVSEVVDVNSCISDFLTVREYLDLVNLALLQHVEDAPTALGHGGVTRQGEVYADRMKELTTNPE
ncbi:uncharacterized protein CIMG_13318 [Coccidioides immitis RS]|uniref:Uncharacterized protein n=1 Tax=Coccidioides immitis (strain RS) TaxID=246410 RepID=A0A0D8JU90_COCIM|nr:uncharacterized protein CIMG_13318 [Coccidioides immitis RS]KJF60915.1 hypothetical protein CIMG_13318 [Coccidioides immitis RS]